MRTVFPFLKRLGDLALSSDPAQRVRIARSLMSAVLYVCCLLLQRGIVALGLADATHAATQATLVIGGAITFYALLRSGWNRRLADPSLTTPQMTFALLIVMLGYAINPAVRSAELLIGVPVMIFGMFALAPARARRLTALTIAAFGTLMLGLAVWRPPVYDPHIEVLNFLIVATVLSIVATLSGRFTAWRERLRAQRSSLQLALATLEQRTRVDELTGLVNRRHMIERLGAEARRRSVDASPACIGLVDLDHFKRVNDCFGHAGGDEVLRRFGAQALRALRAGDVVARWGGEEFLLLLPATGAAEAGQTLERLRLALAQPAVWQDRPELATTFSAGLAEWRRGETAEQAIDRADRAAYRAKSDGRDRWCAELDEPLPVAA